MTSKGVKGSSKSLDFILTLEWVSDINGIEFFAAALRACGHVYKNASPCTQKTEENLPTSVVKVVSNVMVRTASESPLWVEPKFPQSSQKIRHRPTNAEC